MCFIVAKWRKLYLETAHVTFFSSPAVVLTRFAENLDAPKEKIEKMIEAYKTKQPLGFLSAEQISEGILFLCSSEMVTGVSLPVDGGLLNSA